MAKACRSGLSVGFVATLCRVGGLRKGDALFPAVCNMGHGLISCCSNVCCSICSNSSPVSISCVFFLSYYFLILFWGQTEGHNIRENLTNQKIMWGNDSWMRREVFQLAGRRVALTQQRHRHWACCSRIQLRGAETEKTVLCCMMCLAELRMVCHNI